MKVMKMKRTHIPADSIKIRRTDYGWTRLVPCPDDEVKTHTWRPDEVA